MSPAERPLVSRRLRSLWDVLKENAADFMLLGRSVHDVTGAV